MTSTATAITASPAPTPASTAFVARVVHDLDVFGQARFVLADDVGLGKTVQLGMTAELIALTNDNPVLVLAPKNFLLQWQEELLRMLAMSRMKALCQKKPKVIG